MSTVIEVDDLWKKYRLGVIGTGTLRHDFERWWHRVRGKPDPYSEVDQKSEIRNRKSELATNVDHHDLWCCGFIGRRRNVGVARSFF